MYICIYLCVYIYIYTYRSSSDNNNDDNDKTKKSCTKENMCLSAEVPIRYFQNFQKGGESQHDFNF